MEEIGEVVERGEDMVNVVILDGVLDGGGCGTSSCRTCNAFSFVEPDETKVRHLRLNNVLDAEVGDMVVVEFRESSSILSSLLIYVFPILMLILGYFVGVYVGDGIYKVGKLEDDVFGILFSFLFLLIGLVIVYYTDKYLSKFKSFSPQMKSFYKLNATRDIERGHIA